MRSLVVLASLVLSAIPASAQLMGLYSDAQGTNCAIDVPLGTTATCYIVLKPSPTCGTIQSGTCWIVDGNGGIGVPRSTMYTVSSEPGPQVVTSTGAPNFVSGASYVIDCHNDGTSPIVLYTLTVTNFADTFGGQVMRVNGSVTRCGGVSCNNSPKESSWNIDPGRVASLPTPADFATDVPTNLQALRWNGGEGGHPCEGPSTGVSDIYFGTSPNPPLVATTSVSSRYNIPIALQRVTTYYWRIETTKLPENTRVIGPTWRFSTTGAPRYCALPCPASLPCPGGCILGQCITEPAASASATEECGIGGPALNHGSINRRTGAVSANSGYCFDGATSSSATAVDRFWIGGPPSPTPIPFRIVFQCQGSGVGRLRVDEQDVSEFFVGTRTFSFDLTKNVDEPFEVEYHVTGAPATQTGTGTMFGALGFQGLPAGYTPFSCWGYGSSVAVQPATWSLMKSLYR